MTRLQYPNPVVFYMGKQMRYQVALSILIAAEPDMIDKNEDELKELIDQDYAPDRVMSYRNQGGTTIAHGYVDLANTERSTAREKLDALIEALPDVRYGIGGGGGPAIELLDPEVIDTFLVVVRDIAQRYMEPIAVGVILQQILAYLENRRDAQQMKQDAMYRELQQEVGVLSRKLAQYDENVEKDIQQSTQHTQSLAEAIEEEADERSEREQ